MTLPMVGTKRVFNRLAVPVLSMLCLAVALPVRLDAQCTLLPQGPKAFEPSPPGAQRQTLNSGFNVDLQLFQLGGSPRMMMMETFGYSVLDLSSPGDPAAITYDNMAFSGEVPSVGDGQSYVASIGVSSDGQRFGLSLNGNAKPEDGTVVGSGSGTGFNRVTGGFNPPRGAGGGVAIQHVGSRYIAYALLPFSNLAPGTLSIVDVTNIPASFGPTNLTPETMAPGGFNLTLAGDNVLYLTGGTIRILDASNPGPAGNIQSGFQLTTISSADLGGNKPTSFSAAVDPTDPAKLWLLVELQSPIGYAVVSVKSGVKTLLGQPFAIPTPAGESWSGGGVSALVPNGSSLFALMWAKRSAPTVLYRMFSTSVSAWGTSASQVDVDPVSFPTFGLRSSMRGLVAGATLYAYVPTGNSAYVLPLSCVSANTPAIASMAVTNQAGAALADGATVFLGDTISITPSINPPTSLQPLTGFGWNFDFDFHASEDTGASPHIRANDNTAFGSGATPPSLVTVVGPCDYQVPSTSPGSGAGCWNSVTTNAASGGPDFSSTSPSPGTAVPLKFAFEASNSLGSAGLSTFTLNWKVPQVRLASAQILTGGALTAAPDGHPSASGYKWYSGDAANSLALEASCTTATCVPTLQATGPHYYWVTVPYSQIGYTTADCPGAPSSCTSNLGSYVVTDFAAAFKVNGSATGPVAAFIGQPLTVSNNSQRGATVTGAAGYFYSLCQIPSGQSTCADSYVLWGTMGDAPPSGSPPTTATIPNPGAGNWLLKIEVNYLNPPGTAKWPDPAGTAGIALNVLNVVPQIHVFVNGLDPCAPGPFANCTSVDAFTGDALVAWSYVSGAADPTPPAISWTFPGASPASGSGQGVALSYATGGTHTITMNGYGSPFTIPANIQQRASSQPLSASASAVPNPAGISANVNFACSASGGSGAGYTFSWSGAVPGSGQNISQRFATAGSYTERCDVTDSAGHTAGALVNLTVTGGSSGCSTSDFHIVVAGAPSFPSGGFQVAVGDAVTFIPAANYSTYSWNFGDGSAIDTTQSPTHAYAGPGTYTVSLTADGSCTRSYPIVVTGTGTPGAPSGTCTTVDYSILDGTTQLPACGPFGCSEVTGQALRFVPNPAMAVAFTSWDFGDGSTSTTNPGVHTYLGGGTYTVTLTAGSCKKTREISISGPPALSGAFRVKYSDASAFQAAQVSSGKAMTFLAIDAAADTYTWDFGDGSLPVTGPTQQTPSHTYNAPGSESVAFTATLSVTRGSGASSQQASTAQTFTILPPPEPPKWFVAGMAYVQGGIPGTVWQSDVTILNPDPTRSGTYSIAFLDALHPVDPASIAWKTISLGPEQSASSPNVLGAFFGQPLGSFGSLLVRGDVAPVPPVITARTFNAGDPAKGTFGLSVPSTPPSSGLTTQAALSQQLLIGLRDDDAAYTNIGLMNVTTDWSHARLTFFDRSGSQNLGHMNVDVPPYGVAQLTRPLAAPQPNGVDFPDPLDVFTVQVTILSGGSVFPYATVIDRRSTDSIVVTASDRPSSTYRMPGIIRLQGSNGTVWRSRFYITNPSTTSRQATISYSYVACDETGQCADRVVGLQGNITMGPGETLFTDDFPKTWLSAFGETASDTTAYQSSYIDITPTIGDPNQDPLLVLGETYNDGPAGPVGLQVPGFTDADAASKTGAIRRLVLTGLVSNDSFRTNVALFLQSGASGRCTIRVLSAAGAELAHQDIGLGGSTTFVQLNDSVLFGSISDNKDQLTVVLDSFDGSPISAYATIIDNISGDATFVKAQPAS